MLDFIRIACAVPAVKPADVAKNAADICAYIEKADAQNVDLLLFPELSLTGYSCGDLFFQDSLLHAVKKGLGEIAFCSGKHPNVAVVVGFPLKIGTKLYNCAAMLTRGEVNGIVPKVHLDHNERRWFCSGKELDDLFLQPEDIGLIHSEDFWDVPVQANTLFRLGDDAVVGIEICQDLMVPQPKSSALAVGGAEVILNLAASHELAGKHHRRRSLVENQSAACSCIYAFASAGFTESTSDLVFSGYTVTSGCTRRGEKK